MERFQLKPTIYFGPDALAALDALAGKRVMVITDAFLSSSGLLDRVTARLTGCTVERFTEVVPDPSLALVARGARALADFRPEAVVAFGGGSPMDCAKAMVEFGKKLEAGLAPLFYAVPTTAGTGSEVTSFAVLTDTERGVKYPLVDDALLPDAAVLDASLLAGVPPAVTADTGMDVLTHAAEAYVAKQASPFSDALAEQAFSLAYEHLKPAYETAGESRAKENMLLASCMAGMAFNAAGLGLCHGLAHSLGGRYHVPHGRLNALLLPTAGHVTVEGMDTAVEGNTLNIRKKVGMVFQNPDNQIVTTIVEEDVAFGPENLGVHPEEIRRRVNEALKAVGMEAYARSAPHMLSGGQKQRIAIAGMLAMEPEVLVLDEATAMLDPQGRREVLDIVGRLNRERGMTVVMITQYMEEALAADRVIVMADGRLIAQGTPREVFSRGRELRANGLDLPPIAMLRDKLIDGGMNIPADVITAEELAEAICPLK